MTSKSKSPELRICLGHRSSNEDGFTYLYGRFKGADRFGHGGYRVKTKRNIDSIGKLVRYDKRAVKGSELRRILKECLDELLEKMK